MISFTGSTAVGKRIAARGADTLKRVFLELGGKSANIMLDDADFPAAIGSRRHGVHALRPGLRDHDAHAAAAVALRRGRRARQGVVRVVPVRRPDRPRQHGRPADQRPPARAGARLHREGQGRRREVPRRRRPRDAVRQGLLRAADAVRRRRPRLDDRAGGDLRPGARRSSRTTDDDDAVRIANNSRYGLSGAVDEQRRSTARWVSPAASAPARCRSTAASGSAPTRRSAATRRAASAASTASQGFEEYLETKTIGLPGSS